jgi:hypothetical protein
MNLTEQYIYKCNHKKLLQEKLIQTVNLFFFIN